MIPSALLRAIESHETAVHVNLANGYSQALRIARDGSQIQELFDSLGGEDELLQVSQRIQRLAAQNTDFRYENPHDVALFVYLLALRRVDVGLARMMARHAMKATNLFWARKIAERLLAQSGSHNESAGTSQVPEQVTSRNPAQLVADRKHTATFSPTDIHSFYMIDAHAALSADAERAVERAGQTETENGDRTRTDALGSGTYPSGVAA